MNLAYAIKSGGTGTGGSGTAAPASNVIGATVSVRNGLIDNAPAYGFEGTFTLPTTDPLYHQPKFVHPVVTLPDGSYDEVCPPVPAGTTTFQGSIKFRHDGVDHNIPVTFLAENEDGSITATPFSVLVTVVAPVVTSLVVTDNTAARWKDYGGSLHAVLPVALVLSQYSNPVTLWTVSPQYGRIMHGWFPMAGAGTINIGQRDTGTAIFPPTVAAENVVIYAAVGKYDSTVNPATVPGVRSVTISVAAPGVYAATGSSSASAATLLDVSGTGGAKKYYVQFDFGLPLADPKFFFAQLSRVIGKYVSGVWTPMPGQPVYAGVTGTPIGNWAKPTFECADIDHDPMFSLVGDIAPTGLTTVRCLFGPHDYPTDGWDTLKFFLNIATRQDDGSGGTKTEQATWPGGAASCDVVLDPNKAKVLGPQVVGTVPSAANVPWGGVTGGIEVGGGSASQSVMLVKDDITSAIIGWFGKKVISSVTYVGLWVQNLWAGGTGPTDPRVWIDGAGNGHFKGRVESGSDIHVDGGTYGQIDIDNASGIQASSAGGLPFAQLTKGGFSALDATGAASITPGTASLSYGKFALDNTGKCTKFNNIPTASFGLAPIVFNHVATGLGGASGVSYRVSPLIAGAALAGFFEVSIAVALESFSGTPTGDIYVLPIVTNAGTWGSNGSSFDFRINDAVKGVTFPFFTDGSYSASAAGAGIVINIQNGAAWVNAAYSLHISIRRLA